MVCSWNDNSVISSGTQRPFRLSNIKNVKVVIEGRQKDTGVRWNSQMPPTSRTRKCEVWTGWTKTSVFTEFQWGPKMVVAYVCFPSRCLHAERLASLYRHTAIPLDLLALKRSVVDVYRRVHVAEKRIEMPMLWTPKSAQKRKRTPDDIRLDGRLHHVSSGPTQRSCRQCGEKTKMLCLKCDAPLHVECSPVIHEI